MEVSDYPKGGYVVRSRQRRLVDGIETRDVPWMRRG